MAMWPTDRPLPHQDVRGATAVLSTTARWRRVALPVLALLYGSAWAQAGADQGDEQAQVEASVGSSSRETQPESQAELASLPTILRAAWSREPRILEASSSAAAAGYDVDAAQVGYFPFATVTSSQGEEGGVNTTLRLVQPLWNGGRTTAEVSAAREGERAARAEVQQARLEVGREVIEAYFDLIAAETQVEQWDRHIAALSDLVDIISRRAAEGVAPDADVQTAISRVRQAEAQRELSRAAGAQRQAELQQLVDQRLGRVNWPPSDAPLSGRMPDRSIDQVLEEHPAVLSATAYLEQQQAETERQRAALMPELQLQYRVDVEGVRNNQADGFLLALEYETGNGLRGYQNSRAQRERSRAAQQRVEGARRQVVADINVARSKVVSAIAQRRAQAAAVAATEILLDSFLRQFEVGRKSWVEVLNASREANETVQQAILAERDFWKANARLALDSMAWDLLVGEVDASQASPNSELQTPSGQPETASPRDSDAGPRPDDAETDPGTRPLPGEVSPVSAIEAP